MCNNRTKNKKKQITTPEEKKKHAYFYCITNMKWGSKGIRMRDTVVSENGAYTATHLIDQPQSLYFKSTDNGHFYLSEEKKAEQKYDRPTGEQRTRVKTKYELLQHLKREGFKDRVLHTMEQLNTHTNRLHVPLEITEDVIKLGWVGANKGLLQVLWERGFVDEYRWSEYSIEGKKSWRDQDGKIKDQYRPYLLQERMNNFGDFKNEKSAMEVLCDELSSKGDNNVYLLITPSTTPKLQGRGLNMCGV